MLRYFLSFSVVLMSIFTLSAQKLMIGEKAPDMRVSEWLESTPSLVNKALFIDFFHSANEQCIKSLTKINALNDKYGSKMNFVVLNKEGFDKIGVHLKGKGFGFYMGHDEDGKTFSAYDVRFVPFSAIIDSRGRLVWTGNVNSLTDDVIERALK